MQRPFWVQVGLFTVKTRSEAMSYCITSLVGAGLLFLTIVGIMNVLLDFPVLAGLVVGLLLGGFLGLAGLWYWLCIRWMDANRGW